MSVNNHEFLVICAGLPRTGTNSLRLALETLCGGNSLHTFAAIDLDIGSELKGCLLHNASDDDIKHLFAKYDFRVGSGVAILGFWERVMNIYPKCKVILNVRDPKCWEQSMKETVIQGLGKNNYRTSFPHNILRYIPNSLNRAFKFMESIELFGELINAVESNKGIEFYENWNEYVKNNVPKDRLLVYEVKDGWEPLCKFLHKPIPSTLFPKTNSKDFFRSVMIEKIILKEQFVFLGIALVSSFAVVAGAVIYNNANISAFF